MSAIVITAGVRNLAITRLGAVLGLSARRRRSSRKTTMTSVRFVATVVEPVDDVLFQEVGTSGIITLNRPKVLNAVNISMVDKIRSKLDAWEDTKEVVILSGAGGKALCAGGDVKSIVTALNHPDGRVRGEEFFQREYRLNHRIGKYGKPFVSLMDGVTMGGGLGLSVHGRYRVATENTVVAMPETAIGLCVDVGSTYFLPRLRGQLGVYMGLTGHRLRGIDVLHAGIATHYVRSDFIAVLTKALVDAKSRDIDRIFNEFCTKEIENKFSLESHMERINEYFSADTVEDIIDRLEQDSTEWSKNIVKVLSTMSPTALKVVRLALKKGSAKEATLGDCLKMEYRLVCSALERDSDFCEGVRALLIDKGRKPNWNPQTLREVTNERITELFAKVPAGGDLTF